MSSGGKGSAMRPASVSKEQFANNWDAIFGKKTAVVASPKEKVWFDSTAGVAPQTVGDIVVPKKGHCPLSSGASRYDVAIVISMEPYVMVSEMTDMRWGAQDAHNYLVTGKAGTELLERCMKRL